MPAKPAEAAATDDAAADDGTALDATDEVVDAAEADLAEMDSAAAVQEAVEEVVEEVPLTKEERYAKKLAQALSYAHGHSAGGQQQVTAAYNPYAVGNF